MAQNPQGFIGSLQDLAQKKIEGIKGAITNANSYLQDRASRLGFTPTPAAPNPPPAPADPAVPGPQKFIGPIQQQSPEVPAPSPPKQYGFVPGPAVWGEITKSHDGPDTYLPFDPQKLYDGYEKFKQDVSGFKSDVKSAFSDFGSTVQQQFKEKSNALLNWGPIKSWNDYAAALDAGKKQVEGKLGDVLTGMAANVNDKASSFGKWIDDLKATSTTAQLLIPHFLGQNATETAGGIIAAPIGATGSAYKAFATDRPVVGLADTVGAALSFTPLGAIFNGIVANPITAKVAKPLLQGYEGVKSKIENQTFDSNFLNKFVSLPYQKARSEFSKVTGIAPVQFDDAFNFVSDLAVFWALHKAGEVVGKAVTTKTLQIDPEESFRAVNEVTTGKPSGARPGVVKIIRDLFSANRPDMIYSALKSGFQAEVPRWKDMTDLIRGGWEGLKDPNAPAETPGTSAGGTPPPSGSPTNIVSKAFFDDINRSIQRVQGELSAGRPKHPSVYVGSAAVNSVLSTVGLGVMIKDPQVQKTFVENLKNTPVYQDAVSSGKSPDDALLISSTSGWGTYFLEKLSLENVFTTKPGQQFLTELAQKNIAQDTQESAGALWKPALDKVGSDKLLAITQDWIKSIVSGPVGNLFAGKNVAAPDVQAAKAKITSSLTSQLGFSDAEAEMAYNHMIQAVYDSAGKIQENFATNKKNFLGNPGNFNPFGSGIVTSQKPFSTNEGEVSNVFNQPGFTDAAPGLPAKTGGKRVLQPGDINQQAQNQSDIFGGEKSQAEIEREKQLETHRQELAKLQAEKSGAIQGGSVEQNQPRLVGPTEGEQTNLLDPLNKLHNAPVRAKGFETSFDGEVKTYFNMLRSASKDPNLLQGGQESVQELGNKISDIVDKAESLYHSGKFDEAMVESEKALQYVHERALNLQNGPDYLREEKQNQNPPEELSFYPEVPAKNALEIVRSVEKDPDVVGYLESEFGTDEKVIEAMDTIFAETGKTPENYSEFADMWRNRKEEAANDNFLEEVKIDLPRKVDDALSRIAKVGNISDQITSAEVKKLFPDFKKIIATKAEIKGLEQDLSRMQKAILGQKKLSGVKRSTLKTNIGYLRDEPNYKAAEGKLTAKKRQLSTLMNPMNSEVLQKNKVLKAAFEEFAQIQEEKQAITEELKKFVGERPKGYYGSNVDYWKYVFTSLGDKEMVATLDKVEKLTLEFEQRKSAFVFDYERFITKSIAEKAAASPKSKGSVETGTKGAQNDQQRSSVGVSAPPENTPKPIGPVREVAFEVSGPYDVKPAARIEIVKGAENKFSSRYILLIDGIQSESSFAKVFQTREAAYGDAKDLLTSEAAKRKRTASAQGDKKIDKVLAELGSGKLPMKLPREVDAASTNKKDLAAKLEAVKQKRAPVLQKLREDPLFNFSDNFRRLPQKIKNEIWETVLKNGDVPDIFQLKKKSVSGRKNELQNIVKDNKSIQDYLTVLALADPNISENAFNQFVKTSENQNRKAELQAKIENKFDNNEEMKAAFDLVEKRLGRKPESTEEFLREIEAADTSGLPKSREELVSRVQKVLEELRKPKVIETIDELDEISTRKIKTTKEYQDWFEFADRYYQDTDITGGWPIRTHHLSFTAERVAEFFDGRLNGRMYRTMIKPVYDAAVAMKKEGNALKNDLDALGVLEGSHDDRIASLYGEKKINTASKKAQALAQYARKKYDDYFDRLNVVREKLGVEPIPKRADYITHLSEMNILSELFGGMERVSIVNRIKDVAEGIRTKHPEWSDVRVKEAAKREVEATTGVERYIDAKQPAFQFAKQRIKEFEQNPSVMRSLAAYSNSALRYIHQGENVAKNKAFKDALPPQAKQFMTVWNTEQVAGRVPPGSLSPETRNGLKILRATLGENTILGNAATMMMQLTSFPQVIAFAGVRNTFFGIVKRIISYVSDSTSSYKYSRTKAMRNLETDIGFGNGLIDTLFGTISKHTESVLAKNTIAQVQHGIDFGRDLLKGLMEVFDQFTVGATFEAFHRKALIDGMSPQDAIEYADIMTGKTQANYFQEATPPILNSFSGKMLGQFGNYGLNQWEMFKRDFGKDFAYQRTDGSQSEDILQSKSGRDSKTFFKHFLKFMIAAYLVDWFSDKIFGRQPFQVKDLVDHLEGAITGKNTWGDVGVSAADTLLGYVPFMSSVKYGSLPPVVEVGKDVVNLIGGYIGTDDSRLTGAQKALEKWAFNIFLPFGGNQLHKSLQAYSAITGKKVPLIDDVSKDSHGKSKFRIDDKMSKLKAYFFGPWTVGAASDYLDNIGKKKDAQHFDNPVTQFLNTTGQSRLEALKKIPADMQNKLRDEELKSAQDQDLSKWIYADKNPNPSLDDLKAAFGDDHLTENSLYSHMKKVEILNGANEENIAPYPSGWQQGDPVIEVSNEKALKVFHDPAFKDMDKPEKGDYLTKLLNDGDLSQKDVNQVLLLIGGQFTMDEITDLHASGDL